MKKELSTMPVTLAIMFIWLAVWTVTLFCNQAAPALYGKGIAIIGNEYYRFLTANFVHTNIIHLAANIVSMFWVGYLYEHRVGSLRFFAVGTVCAVLTQIASLCIHRNAEGSIGGSPIIFALCGFAIILHILLPDFPEMKFGTWSGNWLIVYLIAANIPFLPFMNISTLIIHAIAFVFGIGAALTYYLLGLRQRK